jgi:hypothetical protein
LIRDPAKGMHKGRMSSLPSTLKYWTAMRMIRSGQWDAAAVIKGMATTTLRTLQPPADGVLCLIGDSTLKDKRGYQHPLRHTTHHREHDPYTFGFEMVLLIASWDRFRVPIALAPIDPQCRGHQNILLRFSFVIHITLVGTSVASVPMFDSIVIATLVPAWDIAVKGLKD